MLWLLLILSTSAVACPSTLQEDADGKIIVHTEDGTLRGQVLTSFWGRDYYAFQKIPYAQPPTGDLRFQSPRPVQRWNGVKDALDQGPYCPQAAKITYTNSSMSEDCLYLNVFIPKPLNSSSSNRNLTVMFWIHGGGYQNGSGIRDERGPDNFMNLTSILVTFNYRLGALGFLSLEHPNVTTNAGMKDQVLALRWVQRNIAFFGGNPGDVTIFGQSSGGMCVEFHLISPLSRGLFHRTIAESGSSLSYRADYNGTRGAYRLAEVLGHNATSRDDLVQFLSSVPAEDLVAAQTAAATETDGITVALSTTPTVEPAVEEGDEVFLSDTPENLLRAGEFNPLPSIIGVNLLETRDSVIGPGHVDELPYLFYFRSFRYEPSSDDVLMIRRMTGMWVDFAETGDPSLRQPVQWIPTNQSEHGYLEIDLQLSLRYHFLKERMAFWDAVYATYEH